VLAPAVWATFPPDEIPPNFMPPSWVAFNHDPHWIPDPWKLATDLISDLVLVREVFKSDFSPTTNQSHGLQTVWVTKVGSF